LTKKNENHDMLIKINENVTFIKEQFNEFFENDFKPLRNEVDMLKQWQWYIKGGIALLSTILILLGIWAASHGS